MFPTRRLNQLGVFTSILAVVALGLAGCATSASTASTLAPTPTPSTAYKLAVIQQQALLGQHDPLVGQFQSALHALAPKCSESSLALSDEILAARHLLAKHGVTESPLDLLKHLNGSIPASTRNIRCTDVLALYVTLRTTSEAPAIAGAAAGADPAVVAFRQNLADVSSALKPMSTDASNAATAFGSGDLVTALSDLHQAEAAAAQAQHVFNLGPLPPAGYEQINGLVQQALTGYATSLHEVETGVTSVNVAMVKQGNADFGAATAEINQVVRLLQAKDGGAGQSGPAPASAASTSGPPPATATPASLSPVEQAVADYHAAVHATYGSSYDTSSLAGTATGTALAAVQCILEGQPNGLQATGAFFTYAVRSYSFGSTTTTGNTATVVENRHDVISLHRADGTTANNDSVYTMTYTLTNDGSGWKVTDYSWTSPDGSTGGAAQDARPCAGQASSSGSSAPAQAPPPPATDTPTPTSGSSSGTFTVSASVDPSSMPYDAHPTLYAQTTPGAVCSATVVYSTGRSPVSFDGSSQTAGSSGQVSWSWHEETIGDGGTADVTCTLNGQSQDAQASFSVG